MKKSNYNVTLNKKDSEIFKILLRQNNIKFEPSQDGENTYFSLYLTPQEASLVTKLLFEI